jgi:hypothetical protein
MTDVATLFRTENAMGPSTKGVGNNFITEEEEQEMRKKLRSLGLPASSAESKEFEYQQRLNPQATKKNKFENGEE